VEAAVVVERAVLSQCSEFAVEQAADLDAAFASSRAEHAHPPVGATGRIDGGDRQHAYGARDQGARAFVRVSHERERQLGRRADLDHATRRERPCGDHEHSEQHERGGAPVSAP
jgi:hypothetical protein